MSDETTFIKAKSSASVARATSSYKMLAKLCVSGEGPP